MPFTRRGPHGNKLRLRPDRLRLPFAGLALGFDRLDARFPPGRLEPRLDGLGLHLDGLSLPLPGFRPRLDGLTVAFDGLGPPFAGPGLRLDKVKLCLNEVRLAVDRLGLPLGRPRPRFDRLGLPFHRLALRFNRLSLERLGSALGGQTVHPGRRIGEPGRGCGVFPARPRVGPRLRR